MPELPEVEVVRRGLANSITGRQIVGVRVLHPRPVRSAPRRLERFIRTYFGPNSGYAQQYLFHYMRTQMPRTRKKAVEKQRRKAAQ